MFKLLAFPFGNEMLFIGMITECGVFILSAFDTPLRDYEWDHVFPALATNGDRETQRQGDLETKRLGDLETGRQRDKETEGQGDSATRRLGDNETTRLGDAGTVSPGLPVSPSPSHSVSQSPGLPISQSPALPVSPVSPVSPSPHPPVTQSPGHPVSPSPGHPVAPAPSPEFERYAADYSQQMEALNRNIAGLNTIYEIQLKSISGQIDTIEHINSGLNRIKHLYDDSVPDSAVFRQETEKMTAQLKELNQVYARLIEAMTVNMGNTGNTPRPNA
ncbi:gliding motility protein GldL [Limibacterium fermenti]|uniref:type IX secretion system motor protein PorL/GldL n=1 Tax=Limibacterium fermenti TaxID=3229863 RepID=UPI003A772751